VVLTPGTLQTRHGRLRRLARRRCPS
jgi:hypothetical protein